MTEKTPTSEAGSTGRLCPNCGSAAPDRFCPRCGQEQSERLVSTRRMLGQLVEDTFSLEARLPRTLIGLVFRPGFLTREYLSGRIARYVQPFRLYLAASLVFFLALSIVADFEILWNTIGEQVTTAADERYVLLDSRIDIDKVPGPLKPLARVWLREQADINALERREGVRVLYDATIAAVPSVVFLLVPFIALVLKALYRRRLYVEHAVFVLHFHALAFLLAAPALLIGNGPVAAVLAALLAAWLFIGLRRVYGGPVWMTALKYAGLLLTYWIAFALTVAMVIVVAVVSA